jgi:hypothetical protein
MGHTYIMTPNAIHWSPEAVRRMLLLAITSSALANGVMQQKAKNFPEPMLSSSYELNCFSIFIFMFYSLLAARWMRK